MNELFLIRVFTYSILPLLLATGHILFDKNTSTRTHQIELFIIYLLAISVGANGLGGGFGHLFYSDLVAEGIGWQAGSPFQLEMGFSNLALGILGLMAVGRRNGFRTATIIATTVIGLGATGVHMAEIVAHGNLSPGNTIQNVSNLLDPILLIALTGWASRINETEPSVRWQAQHGMIAGLTAAGIGIGFAIGYTVGVLLPAIILGTLIGTIVGLMMTRGATHTENMLAAEQQ